MTNFKELLSFQRTRSVLLAFIVFFSSVSFLYSQNKAAIEKVSPSVKLSYKIINGTKSVKVEVSQKIDKKFVPVEKLIVNLYLSEIKKYDPVSGDGWVSNQMTNDEGVANFVLSEKFNAVKAGTHVFKFIASIGSDPVFEDTQEEITMTEAFIDISSKMADSLTEVSATLTKYQDSAKVVMPETELKLCVKRAFGMLPFGEENLTTNESGMVSGLLPADLPGNSDRSITIVARYEDQENEGIIEQTKTIPWKILPRENKLNKRTLWSTGANAPFPLVIVTVSLIALIWGTIFYLFSLLLKIKKLK